VSSTRPFVGICPGTTIGARTMSKASTMTATVSSVEPSSTTTTSKSGYRIALIARTASTIPAASL
jgi:hypothetical protein